MNLGKLDALSEPAMLQSALESAGAPAGKIQRTDLRGAYSYAFVAEEDVAAFEGISGQKHGEKAIKVERARK